MSDQDFFFDEDEKPAKTAPKAPAKKGTGSTASRGASVATAAPQQSVTMTIAVLIGIIGLLLGVVIGLFVGKSMAVPTVATSTGTTTGATTGGTSGNPQAPQLTPEQLQSGQLPAGHPSIGAGAGSGTTTPTK